MIRIGCRKSRKGCRMNRTGCRTSMIDSRTSRIGFKMICPGRMSRIGCRKSRIYCFGVYIFFVKATYNVSVRAEICIVTCKAIKIVI